MEERLYLPVILGTSRRGRMSVHAARLVAELAARRPGVTTELIDIADLPLPVDDAGEAIRDPDFAGRMDRADGLIVVSPEYNHSFPGLLKHALDSCLEQYIHKPVGIVGVSAGPFGGSRGIQSFLPVARELGLAVTFTDVTFGRVHDVFAEDGRLLEPAFEGRVEEFLKELVWMATTLRWGRRNLSVDAEEEAAEPLACPACGAGMNHHANKLSEPQSAEEAARVEPALGGLLDEAHSCPACGHAVLRRAG